MTTGSNSGPLGMQKALVIGYKRILLKKLKVLSLTFFGENCEQAKTYNLKSLGRVSNVFFSMRSESFIGIGGEIFMKTLQKK